MEPIKLLSAIEDIISAVDKILPSYLANSADYEKSIGNVALCIIDEFGRVHGKMYGTDKIKMRQAHLVAWKKASQVWITGIKTGEFEKLVFSGLLDEHTYGISKPDFIGWGGGQPITLYDGTKLSIGFSGMRGSTDLEIVSKAVSMIG